MSAIPLASALPKRPASPAELAALIREAAASNTQVRLAGSDSLPLTTFAPDRPVQTLSTLRMNKLLEHAIPDMTVIVEAGISLEALQRQLAWQNQWLPVDPPASRGRSPGQRTLGGLIASNSLGPLRFSVGDWRLLIMGIRWIDGQGNLIKGGGRTVKNVAGYSSPRMLIGSCGSLGAIAEVTLRTFARPPDEQCVIFFADTAHHAETLIAAVLLSPTTPAYIEAVGGRTFSSNPLELPTMKRGVAVAVGFLDRPQSCAAQIQMLRQLPAAQGLESISQTAPQSGRLRLWLTSEPAIPETVPGIAARIHAASSQTCAIVADLEQAAASAGGSAWTVSEAASGIIRTILLAPNAPDLIRNITAKHEHATFFQTQGPASASTPPGLVQRIKHQLDPAAVFGTAP